MPRTSAFRSSDRSRFSGFTRPAMDSGALFTLPFRLTVAALAASEDRPLTVPPISRRLAV
ncbi:hypothetical protein D3C85_1900910 [compost metagenome]